MKARIIVAASVVRVGAAACQTRSGRLGQVQRDAMSEGVRASFTRAQGGVGHEWAAPAVRVSSLH